MYSLNFYIKKGLSYRIIQEFMIDQPLSENDVFRRLSHAKIRTTLKTVKKHLEQLYSDGVLMKIDESYLLNEKWIDWAKSLSTNFLSQVKQ